MSRSVWGVRDVGSDNGVGVAVADDLEVEVVGVPAAGEHRVQLLPGFLPRCRPCMVSAVTPWAVDGGGVAEAGRLADIVGGESDGELAAVVPDFQVAISADCR